MSDVHDARSPLEAAPSWTGWPSECEICKGIWAIFTQPELCLNVKLGAPEKALATQCHAHKPLVQAFLDYARKKTPLSSENASHGVKLVRRGPKNSVMIVENALGASGMTTNWWFMLLLKKESIPHHPGTGRILNNDWVDLDMLKRWKDQCLSVHGAECENPLKIWPMRPAWLIDVNNKCLVPGQVSGAFVALSYRYGRFIGGIIDAVTLKRLQEPHALDTPELQGYLSPIIRHAMYLTSVIGERYLWADAVCIPHTDEAMRREELNMMGAIYANAVVTIIAADGDAQDGLPGIQGVSQPRKMDQRIIPLGNENVIVRNTSMRELYDGDHHSDVNWWRGVRDPHEGDHYYRRGWTFQECRMAKRKIFFRKQELHWECHCSTWHEEMVFGAETDVYRDQSLSTIAAGSPDVGYLSDILGDYNRTDLRFDQDALPAVSGLLSVMSRSFPGGFMYGIPEMFFDIGIGWSTDPKYNDLRRRTPSERPIESQISPSGLPSWSWVGWQGLIDYMFGYHTFEEAIPVTEWYTSKSPSDLPENRRRIMSTYFAKRDGHTDLAQVDIPKVGYVVTGTEWFRSLPVANIQDSTMPIIPEQTPYLFCNTRRAHLWGRQSGDRCLIDLLNSSGRYVGQLRLHNEELQALFPGSASKTGHGLPVEVVLVLKGLRRPTKLVWDPKRETWDEIPEAEREEIHTVLWVEWKDGVAYRLASGEVRNGEWNKLDTESIDLVLG